MFFPKFVILPLAFLVLLGGLVYSLIMGFLTGYFSICVGLLFALAGTIGLIAVSLRRKPLAYLYLIAIMLATAVACVVDIVGTVEPDFVSTRDGGNFGGLFEIKYATGPVYFGGGLLFVVLFCIPCNFIACIDVCHCCCRERKKDKDMKSKKPNGKKDKRDKEKKKDKDYLDKKSKKSPPTPSVAPLLAAEEGAGDGEFPPADGNTPVLRTQLRAAANIESESKRHHHKSQHNTPMSASSTSSQNKVQPNQNPQLGPSTSTKKRYRQRRLLHHRPQPLNVNDSIASLTTSSPGSSMQAVASTSSTGTVTPSATSSSGLAQEQPFSAEVTSTLTTSALSIPTTFNDNQDCAASALPIPPVAGAIDSSKSHHSRKHKVHRSRPFALFSKNERESPPGSCAIEMSDVSVVLTDQCKAQEGNVSLAAPQDPSAQQQIEVAAGSTQATTEIATEQATTETATEQQTHEGGDTN